MENEGELFSAAFSLCTFMPYHFERLGRRASSSPLDGMAAAKSLLQGSHESSRRAFLPPLFELRDDGMRMTIAGGRGSRRKEGGEKKAKTFGPPK